jgi:MFS family permease
MPPQQQSHEELREPLLSISEESSALSTRQLRKNQRNVTLTLVYTGLAFAGRSIWSQSVLSTFVYFLRNDNPEAVGYITAVMGISQLVASFPAGYVADAYRRDTLLRASSVMGVTAIAATTAACWQENYVYLVVALSIWGCCYGFANTTLSALFADSIQDGERAHYFTQRAMLRTLGNVAGPVCALALFALLGDSWTLKDCAIVMAVGQMICFPAVVLLCFFDDSDDVVDGEEDVGNCPVVADNGVEECRESKQVVHQDQDDSIDSCEQNLLLNSEEEIANNIEGDDSPPDNIIINVICNGCCCIQPHRVIPIVIAVADMISGLGSGMSLRYFPLFFMDNLKLSPVKVQVIYILSPLAQVVLMKISQHLAKSYGRCHVTVAFKWMGILLMLLMIAAYSVFQASPWLVCLLFIIRTGFMNSCGALTRSMLMDNVPSHERGRWSALESVNMFSWSGSAALGGVLVGWVGIVPLFAITASIQFVSSLVVVSLFGVDTIE